MSEETEQRVADAAIAAEQAKQAVADEISAVNEQAQGLVEIAAQRAENAEAAAQAITDASVMTHLGQRMDKFETEREEWRGRLTGLEAGLLSITGQMTDLASRLTAPPPMPASEPKGSPIPPSVSKTELVIPEDPSAAEGGPEDQPPAPPKRRRSAL